jgi:hypothetical protein
VTLVLPLGGQSSSLHTHYLYTWVHRTTFVLGMASWFHGVLRLS